MGRAFNLPASNITPSSPILSHFQNKLMIRAFPSSLVVAFAIAAFCCTSGPAAAQQATGAVTDSTAVVTVIVRRDSTAGAPYVDAAVVRSSAGVVSRTNARGQALLNLPPGQHVITVARLGFRPDSIALTVRARVDTTVTIALGERLEEVSAIMVSATRTERRVEDTPLRVEIIDEEEVAEKVAMSPGDITMMLNETSGLRVQSTNPSLGGANVRIQGLRGRYSLLLADGLPLYGGQTGGLGLLQIPPVDLAHVEIIKGTASALYGSAALGGVIDLISRRPGDETERTVLLNQTSRSATDAVFFGSANPAEHIGATLLASANTQARHDLDADGWTDMPGYTRYVVRPRLYLDNKNGRTTYLTGGFTDEQRNGGTLGSAVTPDGSSYTESLKTRRADVGALARWVIPDTGTLLGLGTLHSAVVTARGSAVQQRHAHQFGTVREDDQHTTWFGEASVLVPRGRASYVFGAAFQQESYHANDVAGFNYTYSIPAVFTQLDVDARSWLSLSASARADAHSKYGTFVNPRISALLRPNTSNWLSGWTARISGGTGAFAPTPFVEETEVTGLRPLRPPTGLVAERAASGSIDVGGPVELDVGMLELNATLFASRVTHPLQVVQLVSTPGSPYELGLTNAPAPTQTWGSELLARLVHQFGGDDEAPTLRVTGTYTYLRSTECDAALVSACYRTKVALTPQHSAGVVTTIEQEGLSRVGLELYYTGRQRLDENPYRTESRPYLIVGLMAERAFQTALGSARLFLNFENLTNVRQTRFDPLLLPARGAGGRWTTDAWTDLAGFTTNGGIRFTW